MSARRRWGGARASARREQHVGAVLHTYSRDPRAHDAAAFSQKPSPSHAGRERRVSQVPAPASAGADGSYPTAAFTTHLMEGAAAFRRGPTAQKPSARRCGRAPFASGTRRWRRFVRPTQRVGGVLYTYFAAAVRGGLIAQKPSASPRPFLPLSRASAPARRATAPRAPRRHVSIPVQGIAPLLGGLVLTEAVAVAAVANAAFSRRPRWHRERIIR